MDEKDVLARLGKEWEGLPGEDGGELVPDCTALVKFAAGWKFETGKYPPKNFESGKVGEAIENLVGRMRVVQATDATAVGMRPYVRLDFPPKGYDPEIIDPDQVEMRSGQVKRCLAAALAGGVKGDAAKWAEVQRVVAAAGGLGDAMKDREAIVKFTHYQPQQGAAKQRYAWYPATAENKAKHLAASVSVAGDATAAGAEV